MLKSFAFSPRLCFLGAVLISLPVVAQAPTPPQEFWDYLSEYGDDNGEVLDPLEYDQILSMKEGVATPNSSVANEASPVDKPQVRNADMKYEPKSSAQASSSAMKGARL